MKKVTIILGTIVVLAIGITAGCEGAKEAYLFNQPIYPTCLDLNEVKQMQAKEIERQKWEAEEYLRQHPTAKDKEEHPGPGVHVFVLRF